MKISFDFDGCIAEDRIQKLARKLLNDKHEIWIVSSRVNENRWNWNKEVFAVADKFRIPRDRIIFTDGADKWKFLKDFDIHFDDSLIEIELIEKHLPTCVGVCIYDE